MALRELSRSNRNCFRTGRRGLSPLRREHCGCAVAEGDVWSYRVVGPPPTLELVTHVDERKEYLDVQALISQPTVERFDVAVFHRPTRPDEVELHAVLIRPRVHRFACELGPIIDRDRHRRTAFGDYLR